MISFFLPEDDPGEMFIIPSNSQPLTPSPSFKNVVLKKLDDIQSSKAVKPNIKRRKVNPFGDVVTTDEQFKKSLDEIERKEQPKKKKQK